jgi:hypothetical protein
MAKCHQGTRWPAIVVAIVAFAFALVPTVRAADTFNEQIPFTVVVVNACPPGNPLTQTGNIHIVGHFTVDSNGGHHGDLSSNLDNFLAVDQVTGTIYHGQDNGQTSDGFPPNFIKFNTNELTQRFEVTQDLHGGMEAEGGSAPNLLFKLRLHMTVLSDGTVTADVSDFTVTCK